MPGLLGRAPPRVPGRTRRQRADPTDQRASDVRGRHGCPRCQREQPRTALGRNKAFSDGLTGYCRPCHNASGRASRERNHASSRDFWLRRRYGITAGEFDAMAAEQGGLCLLCRTRPPQHVDHDHLTGQVRGLLCSGCHQGLGNFKDDAARLRTAADDVERHSWQRVREAPGVYRMVPPRGLAAAAGPTADT